MKKRPGWPCAAHTQRGRAGMQADRGLAASPAPLLGPSSPCSSQISHPIHLPRPRPAGISKELTASRGFLLLGIPLLYSAFVARGNGAPSGQPLPHLVCALVQRTICDTVNGGPVGLPAALGFTTTRTHPSSQLALCQPQVLRPLRPLGLQSPRSPPLFQSYLHRSPMPSPAPPASSRKPSLTLSPELSPPWA